MEFNKYQNLARKTAIYPGRYTYPCLGLAGESGEVCEKVKKMIRDKLPRSVVREQVKKELGDVLWYIANLAADFEIDMNDVAITNIEKLQDREERGVLKGSGDDR